MKRMAILILVVVLLATMLAGCGKSGRQPIADPTPKPQKQEEEPTRPEAEEGILSDFSAQELDGTPVDESIFAENKLTMVNIWATFCGPCIAEMPDLGRLAQEGADEGFGIVGVVADAVGADGKPDEAYVQQAKDIVTQTGAEYVHLIPSEDLMPLLEKAQFVPTTVFVDSQGRQVGEAYVGSHSYEDWKDIADKLLGEVEA
ncbi:MAG: TlpA family protein disulfide reductase [Christensenellaceae bacterium]|nr:TlpA family protein disulfide reductase [Christensenellaceae bacterium]